MHLLLTRISYKTAFLIVLAFVVVGTALGLVCLAVCYCLVYNKKKASQIQTVTGRNSNRVELPPAVIRVDSINERVDERGGNARRDSAARKMELELVINKRRSSMVIKKSYPVIDLSGVESKYNKTLGRGDEPKFKNYLKRSQRSFLGYESSSGNSINNSH
jgi:hypothetical protein